MNIKRMRYQDLVPLAERINDLIEKGNMSRASRFVSEAENMANLLIAIYEQYQERKKELEKERQRKKKKKKKCAAQDKQNKKRSICKLV